jgi:hypothetical protein
MKNTVNPGCVDPASQSYPAPPATPSQSSHRNLPVTSNGEFQPLCPANVLSRPSTDGGSGAVTQSTGEQQYRDLRPPTPSETTSRGLPANVSGGDSRPGGLPAEVVIK